MSTTSKYVSVLLVFVCIGMMAPGGGGGGDPTGDVSGKIYVPITYGGAANAWIKLTTGDVVIYTHADENGLFFLADVPTGTGYIIEAGLEGYTSNYKIINVVSGGNTSASFILLEGNDCDGDGVRDMRDEDDDNDGVPDIEDNGPDCFTCDPDSNGNGITDLYDGCRTQLNIKTYNERIRILPDVDVQVDGQSDVTDENGQYSIIIDAGNYTVSAQTPGYFDYVSEELVIGPGQYYDYDVIMEPLVRGAYAGAFQWGESRDCDGVLTSEDRDVLASVVAGGVGDYSDCNPPDKLVQDLDGDGIIGPGDIAIIDLWIVNTFPNFDRGKPDHIDLVDPPETAPTFPRTPLTVLVTDDTFNMPSVGWGVVFEIDETLTTCESATLYGRPFPTIFGTDRDFYFFTDSAFDYTGVDGQVSVPVLPWGCQVGDTIVVNAFIPSDDEAEIWGERFPERLDADESFVLTVEEGEIPPITCAMNRHDVSAKNAGAAIIIMTIPLLIGFIVRKKAINN